LSFFKTLSIHVKISEFLFQEQEDFELEEDYQGEHVFHDNGEMILEKRPSHVEMNSG